MLRAADRFSVMSGRRKTGGKRSADCTDQDRTHTHAHSKAHSIVPLESLCLPARLGTPRRSFSQRAHNATVTTKMWLKLPRIYHSGVPVLPDLLVAHALGRPVARLLRGAALLAALDESNEPHVHVRVVPAPGNSDFETVINNHDFCTPFFDAFAYPQVAAAALQTPYHIKFGTITATQYTHFACSTSRCRCMFQNGVSLLQ